jgi:hypothetical protein
VTRTQARILMASAAWTLYIWVSRIFILAGQNDRSTGFKVVHFVLAAVSIAFALAVGWIGFSARRAPRDVPSPQGPDRAPDRAGDRAAGG